MAEKAKITEEEKQETDKAKEVERNGEQRGESLTFQDERGKRKEIHPGPPPEEQLLTKRIKEEKETRERLDKLTSLLINPQELFYHLTNSEENNNKEYTSDEDDSQEGTKSTREGGKRNRVVRILSALGVPDHDLWKSMFHFLSRKEKQTPVDAQTALNNQGEHNINCFR